MSHAIAGIRPVALDHGVHLFRDVMLPCRDGTRLAADIYLPAARTTASSWPALVQRTPYDKGQTLAAEGLFFAANGYAVVLQDVRGRFASEGEFEPFIREAEDGYDTVAWIAAQPWCTGKVGTAGTSYLACTQAALATLRPPGLAAQFISQGFSNYHTTRSRRGGAYEHHRTHWLFRMAKDSKPALADPSLRHALELAWTDLPQWISLWPLRQGLNPLSRLPSYERALLDFMTRADYGDWWLNPALSLEPYYDQYPDVPVHLLGSWYDPYAVAVTDNYVALEARLSSPVRLLMGPWVHGVDALGWSYAGDVDFGPAAALEYNRLRLAWFDRHLQEKPQPPLAGAPTDQAELEAPVRLFVMGGGSGRRDAAGRLDHGGTWHSARAWPLPEARSTRLYMRAGGELSPEPPGDEGSTSYRFDPLDPQPSAPDPRHPAELFPRGGFDLRAHPEAPYCRDGRPLAARHDVLVYSTGQLSEPIEVTGRVKVELHISSTGRDTDFTARLVDWYPPSADYPDGYALELCQSVQRARYRDSREQATLLEPGRVYRLAFLLPPTANRFAAGHRVRVDVSSSDFPRFDINPNTGEPLGQHRSCQAVINTVYHDHLRPSVVTLPVIPR